MTRRPPGREPQPGTLPGTVYDIEAHEPEGTVEQRLRALGAAESEVDAARRDGRLTALAVELLLSPARGLTIADVARLAAVDEEDARRVWRAWGFAAPEPDDRRFSAADVELVRHALDIEAAFGRATALHTLRVIGLALGRVAEAEVAMLRASIEAPMRAAGAGDADVLDAFEPVITALLAIADKTLVETHRHHLVEHVRRQLDPDAGTSHHNVLDVVVGFADLTGSTRLAAALELDALDHALATFEEATADRIASEGAVLVKRIGDAVMFTTPSPGTAARVATGLVARFARDPLVPPVRVGLAAGRVVARRGDFYGLPVTLAARLQSLAEPSTVLVDTGLAPRMARAGWPPGPARSASLAGFDSPVRYHELPPAGTPPRS